MVGFLLCAVAPAGAAGKEDSITGTAKSPFFNSTDFDAHSGPSGENPFGEVQFHGGGDFTFGGPVTCLNVRGNVATFNIDTIYGVFTAEVTDNAASGTPDVIRAGGVGPPSAGVCPAFNPGDGLITDQVTSGDIKVVDAKPPKVASVTPADGATGVARGSVVVAGFSGAMDKPSVEAAFSLKRTSTGAGVPGRFGWYGNALVFAPNAALASGTSYTATVGAGAKDLAGDALGVAKSWRFTTATQPLIASVMPAANATEVLPNVTMVVGFDSPMDKPSAQAAFSLKRTGDGAAVTGSFGWYGTAMLFKPNGDLAGGTEYTANVSTAAKDLAGHPLPAAKTWRFTTTNRPIIDSVYPADGAAGASRTSVTIATFNKAMDKPSVQAAFSLKRTSNGTPVSGSFSWYGTALIFKPNATLAAGTQYTAAVSGTAKDLAGRTLANATTWRYTTEN